MEINAKNVAAICAAHHVSITEDQAQQLLVYYQMLVEKNKVMNLTSITEFEEFMVKHIVDSLVIGQYVDLTNVGSMIDVGTGAGFPGLPLSIFYPQKKTLLLDSLAKRIGFLDEVIHNLGIQNVETVHSRSEDLAKNKSYREGFDLAVARAVASLNVLSEYCLPYVKVGGMFVAYKSGNVAEEVEASQKAVKVLGGKIEAVHSFEIDGMGRSLVVIRKTAHTPGKYPRKAGTPKNSPIM